jgi:hypothetical protein
MTAQMRSRRLKPFSLIRGESGVYWPTHRANLPFLGLNAEHDTVATNQSTGRRCVTWRTMVLATSSGFSCSQNLRDSHLSLTGEFWTLPTLEK